MPTIIVSYRRDDSKWITGRIVDRLERDYGKDEVFVDIDAIPVGMDFRTHLRGVLDRCDILLAVIGPNWLAADASGRPRVLQPTDWVRIELETALAKNIPVIPVLIDRTPMPRVSDLPESLHDFAFRQAADVDTGRDFHVHMDRLIRAIAKGTAGQHRDNQSIRPAVDSQRPALALDGASLPRPREAAVQPAQPASHSEKVEPEAAPVPQDTQQVAGKEQPRPSASTNQPRIPPHLLSPRERKQEASKWQPVQRVGKRRGIAFAIAVATCVAVVVAGLAAFLNQPVLTTAPKPQVVSDVPKQPPIAGQVGDEAPKKPHVEDGTKPDPAKPPRMQDRFETGAPTAAQKAVLYEEDPNDPNGRQYVGSAIWRTEQVAPSRNQPPEIAIRADIQVPERKMVVIWSLRRNTDQSLPASHTIEIQFKLPPDFPFGGISNVPGVLMKQSEQARGVTLAGLAVKVIDGFFLIGLSSADADRERNVAMLKERQWFDIPVVYNDNRRAILAVEKGTPGERVFAEAFAAWGQ